MRYEIYNLDGQCFRRYRVYDLVYHEDYWQAVTDIFCPVCLVGKIRWAEAGYVPGYRICDKCKRHFLAKGSTNRPILVRVGRRKG